MAKIKKRRGKYYSRVRWYDTNDKIKETQIALKTDKKLESVVSH